MGEETKDKIKQFDLLKAFGYAISVIQIILVVFSAIVMKKLNVLPNLYIGVLIVVGLLFALLWIYLLGKKRLRVVALLGSTIISLVLVVGSTYVSYTSDKLHELSGVNSQIDGIQVFVLKDDEANNLQAAKTYSFGILTDIDRGNIDKAVTKISEEVEWVLAIEEYDDMCKMVDDLFSGNIQAIIMNGSYLSFVTEIERYKDFESKIKSIGQIEIRSVVQAKEKEKKDFKAEDGRVFTIYLSGVDTRNKNIENSNSDVNILITVNLDTRQILMISTPRDYYIPLSISNGVPDKLTHAGTFGIDVSMDTLSKYYNVEIDYYVRVNFNGFKEIIDALGGVNVYSEYSFTSLEGIPYQQGYNLLNGEEALAFARERYAFTEGDRQRGRNQMAVIQAVFNEMTSWKMLANYTTVMDKVSDSVVTSMTYEEITDMIKEQLEDSRSWDIQKYSVNGYDNQSTTYSSGGEVLYVMTPDVSTVNKAREYIRMIYNGEIVKAYLEN